MKRRLLLSLTAFTCLGLLGFFGLVWLTAPAHRINHESFENLRRGMTESEVEGILGVPAGDYEPPDFKRRIYPSSDLFIPVVLCEEKQWKGGGYVINIWFDDSQKLYHCRINGQAPDTFLDKVRRFLRG
jgi:hypothetical protein